MLGHHPMPDFHNYHTQDLDVGRIVDSEKFKYQNEMTAIFLYIDSSKLDK